MVLIHPKGSSIRFRIRSLTLWPPWRVVRASIALLRFVVFGATWGVKPADGSHVPYQSLDRAHATFMPDTAEAINRHPLDQSRASFPARF